MIIKTVEDELHTQLIDPHFSVEMECPAIQLTTITET